MTALARLATILVLAALLLVPAAGGALGASPTPATLLARHVPILVLHPAERFRPVRVDGFLADSDVQRKTADGWEPYSGSVPAGAAGFRLDQRYCRASDGVAASACYARTQAAHSSKPVVYGKAFRTKTRIDLQYWIWYPYNDYSPTVPAGDVWQVHEGDWEAVSVITDLSGKPLLAGYSQHGAGKRRDWAKVPKEGLRPRVYVALGSHANYFTPGEIPLDPRVIDPVWIKLIEAQGLKPVEHTGNGRTVRPGLVRVTAATPPWMARAWAWGEEGYVHFPGNPLISTGLSPPGPAFQDHWQLPVKEVMSWPRG